METPQPSEEPECGKAVPATPVFIVRGGAWRRHSRPYRRASGAEPGYDRERRGRAEEKGGWRGASERGRGGATRRYRCWQPGGFLPFRGPQLPSLGQGYPRGDSTRVPCCSPAPPLGRLGRASCWPGRLANCARQPRGRSAERSSGPGAAGRVHFLEGCRVVCRGHPRSFPLLGHSALWGLCRLRLVTALPAWGFSPRGLRRSIMEASC